MPDLDKKLFAGSAEIEQSDVRKIQLNNTTSDVADALRQFNWKGEACGCITLTLSADNTTVDRGNFVVRGRLVEESLRVEANKIWAEADENVVLALKFPKAEVFSFNERGLSSDILPQEEIQHGFYVIEEERQPTAILEADYADWGIGGFCMRMLCTISKNSSLRAGVVVKFTLFLYPESKDVLLANYELAQSPAWPGMRITEGDIPLLPRPTAPWGCPVLPLIVSGTPLDQLPVQPEIDVLKRTISLIMRKAAMPETGRTGAALLTKWRRLANNPEELTSKSGTTTWPTSEPASATHGKSCFSR